MRSRPFLGAVLAVALALGAASCATAPRFQGSLAPAADFAPVWKPRGPGMELAELAESRGPLRAWALKVDLSDPRVSVVCTEPNGSAPGDTDARKTTSFARASGAAAAVNATPFMRDALFEGEAMTLAGLYVARGAVVSPPAKGFPALVFWKENDGTFRARVSATPLDEGEAPAYWALGGFRIILKAGRETGLDGEREARVAAGTADGGRTLYLLVADGRDAAWSAGLSSSECGLWLRALGARDAILLDGGGSASLALRDAAGKVFLANRPRNKWGISMEQPTANQLGIVQSLH